MLKDLFVEYNSIADPEKEEIDKKYDPTNSFLKEYDYNKQYKDLDVV